MNPSKNADLKCWKVLCPSDFLALWPIWLKLCNWLPTVLLQFLVCVVQWQTGPHRFCPFCIHKFGVCVFQIKEMKDMFCICGKTCLSQSTANWFSMLPMGQCYNCFGLFIEDSITDQILESFERWWGVWYDLLSLTAYSYMCTWC